MANGDEGRELDACILTMRHSINSLGFDYDGDNTTDSLVIDHRNGTLTWDSFSGASRRIGCKIAYCPFCGRLLSRKKEVSNGNS